jgi:hypothetical protein
MDLDKIEFGDKDGEEFEDCIDMMAKMKLERHQGTGEGIEEGIFIQRDLKIVEKSTSCGKRTDWEGKFVGCMGGKQPVPERDVLLRANVRND